MENSETDPATDQFRALREYRHLTGGVAVTRDQPITYGDDSWNLVGWWKKLPSDVKRQLLAVFFGAVAILAIVAIALLVP